MRSSCSSSISVGFPVLRRCLLPVSSASILFSNFGFPDPILNRRPTRHFSTLGRSHLFSRCLSNQTCAVPPAAVFISNPQTKSDPSAVNQLNMTLTLSAPPTVDPAAFIPAAAQDLLARRDNHSAPAKNAKVKEEAAAAAATASSHPIGSGAHAVPSLEVGQHGYVHPHPIWKNEYVDHVEFTHREPKDWVDKLAYNIIKVVRFNFDLVSGYAFGKPTESKVIKRIVFLESVAGVPGSVAGILRHLASLRRMKRDNGWIHTLYAEAENERMHLLTALAVENPGPLMRSAVFVSQGIFFNFFFVAYLVSPRFCHRLVGYLEEQAVKTYTQVLDDWDRGMFPKWNNMPAPVIAKNYWKMGNDAKWRDVILMLRADESHHRDVNHVFGDLKSSDLNPFKPGL